MKKNLRKRIIALVLSAVLCLASSISVFAAEPKDVDSADATVELAGGGASTYSLGNCIGSNSIVASGYTNSFTITLDKSYDSPYFRAMATGNSANAVDCSVTFPDGSYHFLGLIVADGSKTPYYQYLGTVPAGTYTFRFVGTDSGITGYAGFIYSSN